MNFKDIVETIFQMEEELDLFNKQINGVYFWELIRLSVVSQIAQKTGLYGQAQVRTESNVKNVSHFAYNAFKNIIYKNPFFSTNIDIVFWGGSRRKLMDDGFWWNIYCDPVMDSLFDFNSLLLESTYLGNHFKPCKTNNIKYIDFISFIRYFKNMFIRYRTALSVEDMYDLNKIKSRLIDVFNITVDIENIVTSSLRMRSVMLPVYRSLLKRIKPKIVVVICSYGKETFIEACKQQKIPVVELQHGTINRYHTGYSFPGKYYSKTTFPDYFLTFGDYWKKLVQFPIPQERVISTGYPFFDMETAKYNSIPKKNQIVFISQGTIGARMSRFAVELQFRQDFDLDIVYKLHPGEYSRWQKDYPWLVNSGLSVIDDESEPLYKLLAQSKALVGVYSTVVYEGLGMGLPTYLVDLPGIEYMDELIASGAVVKISTVQELIVCLDNTSYYKGSVNSDQFFKPEALNNICTTLKLISSTKVSNSI